MHNVRGTLFLLRRSRSLQTVSHETVSESLKRKVADLEKKRKTRNLKKTEVFVEVPESRSFLDTATMPMMLTAVGVALLAKLLMMTYATAARIVQTATQYHLPPFRVFVVTGNYTIVSKITATEMLDSRIASAYWPYPQYDESRSQELIERKIRHAPPEQGTVRMLTREEWEEIREVRPRTPFESKLARPNARIRTGGAVKKEDVKDWGIDVLMDAVTRVEESVKHNLR